MKRKLLIAVGAVALLGVAQAYGQERTVENYPIKGGDFYGGSEYFLQRVDANADGSALDTPNATSYVTKGAVVPFYIAPSRITHPDWDPNTGVLNPKTFGSPATQLTFSSKWIMKFKTPSAAGVDFSPALDPSDDHANKVTVTGNVLGEYVVQAQEQPVGDAFACMLNDPLDLPEFKLRVVSEPSISIDLDKQTTQDNMITRLRAKLIPSYDVLDGTGMIVPSFLRNKKVILVNTCNPTLLNGEAKVYLVNSKVEAWDDVQPSTNLVPEALRNFAFSIRSIQIKVDKDGKAKSISQNTAATAPVAYGDANTIGSLDKKLAIVDKAEVKVTLPSLSIAGDERSMDAIFFLSSPVGEGVKTIETAEQGGVISTISHRSGVNPEKDKAGQNLKTYDFGDYSIIVVRLSEKPITGPIYHVPTSLFTK